MNRTLKFRVWDRDHSRFLKEGDSNDGFGLTLNGEISFCSESQFGYVDPEDKDRFAIQQWTGLSDKKGKDIYDGDLAQGPYKKVGQVNWDSFYIDGYDIAAECWLWQDTPLSYLAYDHKVEVVGNIFENPELLNETN